MPNTKYTIRHFRNAEDHRSCERLQAHIWTSAPTKLTPADLMIVGQRHEGIAAGAFDMQDNLIGFVFGLPGKADTTNPLLADVDRVIFSHILGVIPNFHNQGIGYKLKEFQREWAMSKGYLAITWTFDPLEASNAWLNIGKLGARSQHYLKNLYGNMQDVRNRGMPSDRLEVVWLVNQQSRRNGLYSEEWLNGNLANIVDTAPPLNIMESRNSIYVPLLHDDADIIVIEIPISTQKLALTDRLRWRYAIREAFEYAFQNGYILDGITKINKRVFYILNKQASNNSLAERVNNQGWSTLD